MTTQMIDGVICRNCSDVDRARKAEFLGVDPSRISATGQVKPKSDPTNPVSAADATGVNQPLATGNKGRSLNLLT